MTLELDWLKRWATYSPNQVALQMGEDGRQMTYAQLYESSLNLASVLYERYAIGHGDRVVLIAHNELESIVLFFALQRLGALLVPVNFRFTRPEIEHIVRDCGAKLVICQQVFKSVVAELGVALWNFEGADSLVTACARKTNVPIAYSSELEEACMILYTSGTTGFPKGAVISHRMILWNSVNTGLRLNLTQNEVVLTFLPLFHTGGWNVLTTPCLHRGARVILLRKFDVDLVLRHCEREKVSLLFGVPTTMDFLRRSPLFESLDLSSIRYAIVGGEPMPLELIKIWEARGIPIRQGYGLTEFGPNVFSLNEEDSRRKMGSIGFPNFYIEAKVVDNQGREVPAGEVGELILRGPVAMTGYWGKEAATAEVLREGWMHTGDLARRDDEGYHYIVGRKKEMFISGGENVYPAEVERVLRHSAGVREVAVIGVRHSKWGESGRAFVAPESGMRLDVETLRAHCIQHLAKFKVPQEFVILSELPKTESGKIAKKELALL